MNWYEALKFKVNPLDIRPNTILIGLEEEEQRLKNHIFKGEVCFINGITGSGKTSLLLKIQDELKDHEFIYLDAHDLPKNFNIEEELKKKKSFFDKLTFKDWPSKKPVVIIDEFQETDPRIVLNIRSKWENPINKRVKSFIIAQISDHLSNVTDSFKERIGSRTITLRPLDGDNLKKMLVERLVSKRKKKSYANRFSDDALDLLIYTSGGNPRRFLEHADLVFDFHHRKFGKINPVVKEDYLITHYAAREILDVSNINCEGFRAKGEPEVKKKRKKKGVTYETFFDRNEKKVLNYLFGKGPSTYAQIAFGTKVKKGTVTSIVRRLVKKGAAKRHARSDQGVLWDVGPHAKRLKVRI
ncbi:AAA family ATPase [Candidatus Woesearchaeota archaeon]|nr:AAA family ATPase [Candidatus Woesearchaeota archaeon]